MGIWIQKVFLLFLTLLLTTSVWALCQSFWNKKSLNNNNFFQLEASMDLLNIFRKNKYYEQFCLKRLYKSHVIELIWRKANRSRRGPGHTIIVDYFVENRERCLKRAAPIWVCTIFVCLLVLHHLLIHPNQLGSGKLFVRGAAEDLGASEALHNLALK